jgi:transcriptional regulator with XRE-family HTH domain
VGISATFLSRIETGAEKAVPSEEVIRKLATALNEDFDVLMMLAGRIPSEVGDYVKADPRLPEFLRRAKAANISGEKLLEMLEKRKKDR